MVEPAAVTIDDREPSIRVPSGSEPPVLRKRSLVCRSCGYGIVRPTPPARCPMCQVENAWIAARYFS